jgi:hypothetical protein
MRLVVRLLFIGFWLAWVRALSRCVSAGVRIWLSYGRAVMAGVRARRVCLGVVIGFHVVTGWPLLFWLIQTRHGYRHWLRGIALPWWIILGATTLLLLAARASQMEPPAGECGCGTCLTSECTCSQADRALPSGP